jgi:hypothetical protein
MKLSLDIRLNRSEDKGYATFSVSKGDLLANGRNMFLSNIEIKEWSRGSDGRLNHYLLKDKPSKSVWRHSASLDVFDSYEACKADLMKKMLDQLKDFVKIVV